MGGVIQGPNLSHREEGVVTSATGLTALLNPLVWWKRNKIPGESRSCLMLIEGVIFNGFLCLLCSGNEDHSALILALKVAIRGFNAAAGDIPLVFTK